MPSRWCLGVIEGFFGRQWSWEARRDYAGFLADNGFDTYVYAPKNDAFLRKRWQEPFPAAHLDDLKALSRHYRNCGLSFGIGLSPFELYRDFSVANRARLLEKLEEINACEPGILCILFDDMMGDLQDLASTQLAIIDTILAHSTAAYIAVCPTYYSDDPLLTRHFGPQPQRYLEDLGAVLDPAVDIFWTGPKVISDRYPRSHLENVAERLRRKPLLWDNYPVNDAKRLVDHLHLAPFPGRNCGELRELCSGHLANPMNEAHLSQIPLHALAARYRGSSASDQQLLADACTSLCPPALSEALLANADLFQSSGLSGMNAGKRAALQQLFASLDHPMATELHAWLRGDFAFDPACLT